MDELFLPMFLYFQILLKKKQKSVQYQHPLLRYHGADTVLSIGTNELLLCSQPPGCGSAGLTPSQMRASGLGGVRRLARGCAAGDWRGRNPSRAAGPPRPWAWALCRTLPVEKDEHGNTVTHGDSASPCAVSFKG